MRSHTQRSATPRFLRADNHLTGSGGTSLDFSGMQNFLRAVFSEMQNSPARRRHVLAQHAGWYPRGK
jgi:hypothetical protein